MARNFGQFIEIGKYQVYMLDTLGDDESSSSVYRARHVDTGAEVAAKRINPLTNSHEEYLEFARKEIATVKSVQGHRNIIRCVDGIEHHVKSGTQEHYQVRGWYRTSCEVRDTGTLSGVWMV